MLAIDLSTGLPELRKELFAMENLGLVMPVYRKIDGLEHTFWIIRS